MKDIIQKAIEGGYEGSEHFLLHLPEYAQCQLVCDSLFWQALGKSCGWLEHDFIEPNQFIPTRNWIKHALRFHEINLTQSWDAAVEYLTSITK